MELEDKVKESKRQLKGQEGALNVKTQNTKHKTQSTKQTQSTNAHPPTSQIPLPINPPSISLPHFVQTLSLSLSPSLSLPAMTAQVLPEQALQSNIHLLGRDNSPSLHKR